MKNISPFLFLLLSIFACKTESKPNANASANPFDTTYTQQNTLTESDRTALLAAKGKTAQNTDSQILTNQLNDINAPLQVMCFWEDNAADEMIAAVNNLAARFDSTMLKVTFVKVSDDGNLDNLTLFLREKQLTESTFLLKKQELAAFSKKINKEIAPLPALLLSRKSEEVLFVYPKQMSNDEVAAVVAPFVSAR